MSARRWRTEDATSTGWHAQLQVGRLQLGFHLYRHGLRRDRLVFQPFLIFDRKLFR